MITEDYCSFEIAKLLKEKGFNELCGRYYNSQFNEMRTVGDICMMNWNSNSINDEFYYISIPTHQMAMKWLREIYGIDIVIEISDPSVKDRKYYCMIWDGNNNSYILDLFNSYEEVVEAALKYSLENLI